jgi:ABC-type transporter Mla MlaB component
MGTKPQTSGLFSKVANIFRSEDAGAGPRDAEESMQSRVDNTEKNALQALIQRKRQDDLVRRREFNHLRKLRNSPHSRSKSDSSERVSSFTHSSSFTQDDRAQTLRKIDAIEAHMINSWAKGRALAPDPTAPKPVLASNPVASNPASSNKPMQFQPTQPPSQQSGYPSTLGLTADSGQHPADALDDLNLDFTGLLSTPGSTEVDTWNAPANAAAGQARKPDVPVLSDLASRQDYPPLDAPELALVAPSAPAASKAAPAPQAAPEPLPEHIEAALQDAAIQFAEGNPASAEAALLRLLQADNVSTATADVLASALFDLYRSNGQQDGFDVVAMDYAERFGRSPAEWFSVPVLLREHAASAKAASPVVAQVADADAAWHAPANLTVADLSHLRQKFADPKAVWRADWSALAAIDAQAASTLAEILHHWCTQPLELHWSGSDALLVALQLQTPENDNTADPMWWQARMDALCILQRHDDFESCALDYCVVYEVSPPSWKAASCKLVQDQLIAPASPRAEPKAADAAVENVPVLAGPYAATELVGEICGDAKQAIAKLEATGESADHIVVSCALTVRMDFPAAGLVLNWVIECQSRECQVQFVQVPRLVAVFMCMLGIDSYAKISVRAN